MIQKLHRPSDPFSRKSNHIFEHSLGKTASVIFIFPLIDSAVEGASRSSIKALVACLLETKLV